jgi:hypothetical protein
VKLPQIFIVLISLLVFITPIIAEQDVVKFQLGYEINERTGASSYSTNYIPGKVSYSTIFEGGGKFLFSDNFYMQKSSNQDINNHNLNLNYNQNLSKDLIFNVATSLQRFQDNNNQDYTNNNVQLRTNLSQKFDELTQLNYQVFLSQKKYQELDTGNYDNQGLSVRGTRQLTKGVDKLNFAFEQMNNIANQDTNSFKNSVIRTNYERKLSRFSRMDINLQQTNQKYEDNPNNSYLKNNLNIGYSQRFRGSKKLRTNLSYTQDQYESGSLGSDILDLNCQWQERLNHKMNYRIIASLLNRSFTEDNSQSYNRLETKGKFKYLVSPLNQWDFYSGYSLANYQTDTQSYQTIQAGFDWLLTIFQNWANKTSYDINADSFPNNSDNDLTRHKIKWQLTYNEFKNIKPSLQTGLEIIEYKNSSSTRSSYNAFYTGLNISYQAAKITYNLSARYRSATYLEAADQDYQTLYIQGSLTYDI